MITACLTADRLFLYANSYIILVSGVVERPWCPIKAPAKEIRRKQKAKRRWR